MSEIQRICNLPIAEPLDEEEFSAVNALHVKDSAPEGFELTRGQAEALLTFAEHGGLFAPLPVGAGKTLIALRCIGIAVEQGLERIVLFVPSQVYSQLINRDIDWVRRRLPLGCTFYKMGGLSPSKRAALSGGRRGCWIMPYSLLSRPDSYDNLVAIRPEMIIFDEAHALKNRRSARTKRVLTYYRQYRPQVVALSGTMTAKSLNDYSHLLMMTLGQKAPVPLDANIVQEWAATLDSEQKQTHDYHKKTTGPGPLRPLIAWSNRNFPDTQLTFDVPGFRRAFLNRLSTAPGVVSIAGDEVGTSLIFENVRSDRMLRDGGAQLDMLLQKLNTEWVTPQGDELEHAMLVWKWNSELTAGIFNSLVWPEMLELVERRGMSEHEARHVLAASLEYHKALQEYHKTLRSWFTRHPHRPGLDTPMLVAGSMAMHESRYVGDELYDSWCDKNDLDFSGRLKRNSIPVRVCDYKIQDAIKWCKKRTQGIIWYHNHEVGAWAYELFMQAGVPAIHCPSGKPANEFLTSDTVAEDCAGKFIICSISAHGTGKNLQFMQDQFFIQLPITETQAEQSVGRTHRKGQEADEITITTCVSNEFDEMALAALLNDSVYVRETMDAPRKLLIATWNPMPIIYGSQLLIRAGAQAKLLTARQQQMLQDRFIKTKN